MQAGKQPWVAPARLEIVRGGEKVTIAALVTAVAERHIAPYLI
jgi:hypothetical protein